MSLASNQLNQAGSEAGGERRRCDRGVAEADSGGFCEGRERAVGAAESAGRRRVNGSHKRIYKVLHVEGLRSIDHIVETSGLNSTEVLATLFDLEVEGIVREFAG
jgi:hypothetical protein